MFEVNGRKYEVDEDGFLQSPQNWNREVALDFATTEGSAKLNEGHWRVVRYIRDYWLQDGIAPMVRRLCKETGYKLNEIYEMFPSGPANGACKVAGLPKPTGCGVGRSAFPKRTSWECLCSTQRAYAWVKTAVTPPEIFEITSDISLASFPSIALMLLKYGFDRRSLKPARSPQARILSLPILGKRSPREAALCNLQHRNRNGEERHCPNIRDGHQPLRLSRKSLAGR